MKADKLTITLSISSVIFAGLLYYFGLCDSNIGVNDRPWPFNYESMDGLYKDFCMNKSQIGGFVFCIIIFIHIVSYINIETGKKKWLRAFLKHVIQQDLGGDQFETRITIFREQMGLYFLPKYIWRCILKRRGLWNRLRNMPSPLDKYLVPYIRYSFPDSTPSTSFFKIAKYNSDKEDSIVSLCYKKGRPTICNTSYIQDIELPEDINNLNKDDLKKIKEYMKDSHMTDYDKLRLIDRKANHLYAVLVQQNEETENMRWGVIVFDKNSETPDNLQDKLKDVIHSYLKITQFSLKIIR